jgi:hypothetical protein
MLNLPLSLSFPCSYYIAACERSGYSIIQQAVVEGFVINGGDKFFGSVRWQISEASKK